MKKITIAVIFLLGCKMMFAQQGDKQPAYISIPTVPPFTLMLLPDSTVFTKDDLKKKRATIIILFTPDCDHCIRATEDLIAHYGLFKKVQIVMATSLISRRSLKFYRDLKIADYPNIKIGIDNTNFLGSFYNLRRYPSVYVYDKKGKFKAFFDGDFEFSKIAEIL